MTKSIGTTWRFAPSATGRAHPGTWLAALLCWLDARHHDGRVLLRIEDLDPQRCTPALGQGLRDDLSWLGLDWDQVEIQSRQVVRHHQALECLAAQGRLYACACSRASLAQAPRSADGSIVYPGLCRERGLDRGAVPVWRCRLDPDPIAVLDDGGHDLGACPGRDCGDPVVRRRDGSVAYHLASVVDDAAAGVDQVVRGRDLAPSTAVQVALARLLDLPPCRYRHHMLLLEPRGGKLAKFHGAVGGDAIRQTMTPGQLVGFLAWVAGLRDRPEPVLAQQLIADFSWQRVRVQDQVVAWNGHHLVWEGAQKEGC